MISVLAEAAVDDICDHSGGKHLKPGDKQNDGRHVHDPIGEGHAQDEHRDACKDQHGAQWDKNSQGLEIHHRADDELDKVQRVSDWLDL